MLPTSLWAATIVMSDFDNTIVETREAQDGTFQTPFVLFRIEQRATTLQDAPRGPAEIHLSPIEFHRNRAYFGKGSGQPGALNRKIELQDGTVVNPGLYYVRNPESFRHFFSTDDRNNPLEDLKAAQSRDAEGKWKGPFWETMVKILANPESARTFGLITARGHTEKDWVEFFEYLKKTGEIENLPNFRLFHNVSLADYDQFSLTWNTAQQKVGVMREMVQHLGRTPVTDERLSPDGKTREPYHYLIFVDDNQETLDAAIRVFQQYAQNKTVRVKFGVFNTGNRTEVTASRRPQYAIIKSDGTFRHATPEEILGEPAQTFGPVRLNLETNGNCVEQLAQKSAEK